ncbi:hypothetical protein AFCA_012553 [Aspergillus flavus]|nr:hypothetical protein AFCA_012553 [Aspergillus flavus]
MRQQGQIEATMSISVFSPAVLIRSASYLLLKLVNLKLRQLATRDAHQLRKSRQKSRASVAFRPSHSIEGFRSIAGSCSIRIIVRSSPFQMDIDMSRRNKKPRLLLESERERLDEFIDSIHYSARYSDDQFEYRHVQLPKNMLKKIPADYFDSSKGTLKLLWEEEWRALGITQSLGWEHYEVHEPEPHILLFKRPLNYQPPMSQ